MKNILDLQQLELMKWLKNNCISNFQIINNNLDYYWCLIKDANDLWDYIDDDRLKWYTDEEIYEVYKNNKK